MEKFHSLSLKSIYRKCNMVVDSLAKSNINHDYGIVEFDHLPIDATCTFLGDLARRSH